MTSLSLPNNLKEISQSLLFLSNELDKIQWTLESSSSLNERCFAIEELRTIFTSVCKDFSAELVQFERENNHVHLLVNYPPKMSVSKLVNSLKGVSSRLIRKRAHQTIQQALWGNSLWSPSYFAGACGGAPLEIIRQYIERQETPHV